MIHGKNVVVVLPAFRAEKTLRRTYDAIPRDVVDQVILVDDASDDYRLEDNALKAGGVPVNEHLGSGFRSYADIGAYQRQESGGGGGLMRVGMRGGMSG